MNHPRVTRASLTKLKQPQRRKSREISSVFCADFHPSLKNDWFQAGSCRVLDSETLQPRASWRKTGTSVSKKERPSFGMTFVKLLVLGVGGRRCLASRSNSRIYSVVLARAGGRTNAVSSSSLSHRRRKPSLRRRQPPRSHPYHARSH